MDWKKKAETLDEIAGYFEICSQNADPTGKAKAKFLQYVKELNTLSETLNGLVDGSIKKHLDGQLVMFNYRWYTDHRLEWPKDELHGTD